MVQLFRVKLCSHHLPPPVVGPIAPSPAIWWHPHKMLHQIIVGQLLLIDQVDLTQVFSIFNRPSLNKGTIVADWVFRFIGFFAIDQDLQRLPYVHSIPVLGR